MPSVQTAAAIAKSSRVKQRVAPGAQFCIDTQQ
jgi:hypothetical protein